MMLLPLTLTILRCCLRCRFSDFTPLFFADYAGHAADAFYAYAFLRFLLLLFITLCFDAAA